MFGCTCNFAAAERTAGQRRDGLRHDEWYGYFLRRLAERPANLAFFLRALLTR